MNTKPKYHDKNLSFRVPKNEYELIKNYCGEYQIPFSQFVRNLLIEKVEENLKKM